MLRPRPRPRRARGRNPRRTGGLLLAVGTLLALVGLSTMGQPAQSGDARATVNGAADAPSALELLPVQVPFTRAVDDPVPLDRLFGPKPITPMSFSVPVHISVPRAGIDADVTPVGLATRSAPGVLPLRSAGQAAWYDLGPAPGQLGVAVVDAHVETDTSDDVRPGDTLEVTRADHSLAVFTVDATEQVPSWRTYAGRPQFAGPAPYAALSLVTCSGSLDTWRHGCLDHTIVHAHLTSGRPLAASVRAY
ncbi:class F sortase [Actinospica durhamensis]|uniref:Class F sortase n=1 Tax=Actinospica durhamensis TaxID=1508375 RepID=A0A941INX1_9ACTN|nr:class F sortase [Actinospica durhamensis]MBR7835890.1 class F sortase [Actinospica durhamensis]